jgi:hypothetical protein
MRLATFLLVLATSLAQGSGEQKCGLVPTKVFLSKGEKRQLVFWTDQDYSMAVAPVESSQATTTENSTLPAVEASEEEEVDTFLQVTSPTSPCCSAKSLLIAGSERAAPWLWRKQRVRGGGDH